MGFLISDSLVRFSELSWCINFLWNKQKRKSTCSWMPEGDEYWHVTAVPVAFLMWNSETNVSCVSQLPIIHSQLELRWQKSLKCWSFAFALCWVGTFQGPSGVYHITWSLSTGAHPMCQAGQTNLWVDALRMKKWKLCVLLCVCVNVFPKYRNKIYPEVAQQWSHGEFRSLHVQFYMLSFAPEVWWCVSGCCRSLRGPWGRKSHFTCQMLVCSYSEMTWTFQIDSNLEASVALQIMFLFYISVAGDMKLTYLHDSLLAYADLWGRGFALWRCLQRIGCDFCKEGLSACSSVPAYIAQGLPRCLQDIIALSANTEKLPLS